MTADGTRPAEPPEGAEPDELIAVAQKLLEHHDEQERPEEAARSLWRCRDVLLRARDALERQGTRADPYQLAFARYLHGLTLSVGYWQAATGGAESYGVEDPRALRREATPLLALSRALLPDDDPVYAHASIRLALLLHDRHENPDEDPDEGVGEEAHGEPAGDSGREPDEGRPDDLEEALVAFEEGLRLLDEEPHPGFLVTYGCGLADLYDRDGDSTDLLTAAALLEELAHVMRPPGGADQAAEADQLEIETRVRLIRLLQASDEPHDVERAHHHLELLAATAPVDHPTRIFAAGHLIDAYHERGGGRVLPEDRPARLARLRDLHRLIDQEDPDHARATALLGGALAERTEPSGPTEPTGRPEPAEGAAHDSVDSGTGEVGSGPTENHHEAVVLLREALDGLSAEDPLRPGGHATLGTLLNSLHDYEPERYDVAEAAFHLERAIALHPDDGPLRSELINHLAHANLADDRGARSLEHIDRTIDLLNESMNTPSETPGLRSHAHGAYAAALSQRHALSHSSDDLDASIRHLTAAFRQTPVSDVNRVVYLQNLGVGLYRRYLAGGDLQDLHAAHRYLSEVTGVVTGGATASIDLRLVDKDRPLLEHGFAQLQFMLSFTTNDTAGMMSAVAAMRRVREALGPDDPHRLSIDADFGLALFVQAFFNGNVQDRLDGLVVMLETVEAFPEGHPDRPRLLLRTAGSLMVSSLTPYNAGGVESAERLLRETLAAVSPDSPEGIRATVLLAALLFNRFRYTGVPADVDQSVEIALEACERLRQRAPSPVSTLLGYGLADALRARAAAGFDTREKRDGVTRAVPEGDRGAEDDGVRRVPGPAPVPVPVPVRDDARAAREAGIAALREAASVVLLQAAAEPALQMARTASDRALQIARWCLADGDLRGALEALELGRGQVLHAATTTSDLPALLREAGRPDLAGEWDEGPVGAGAVRGSVGDLGTLLEGPDSLLGTLAEGMEPPLPDDLRQRALTALARSGAGTALTTPPTPEEIGATLRAADAHALVYLLPPGGAELLPADAGSGGVAVVVTRDGEVGTVELGLLRRRGLDVLTAYREAHRDRQAALDSAGVAADTTGSTGPDDRTDPTEAAHEAAFARWRVALAELSDWAGPVVMAPLLRSPLIRAAGPEPHLVLVPFGELGGIPWHAAVLSSGLRHGGRPVRAVERTVLSYAASARQLQEVTRRPRMPLDASPVIVGNPDDSLPGAAAEARQIHAALYPKGLLLGRVRKAKGPGAPNEILSALPGRERAGASVLHLACHARPSGASPLDACLLLAGPPEGPAPLSVRVILEQARGRPARAPGGLVVLDACVSDHLAGDFDESLTLSTAFLAAGATGVVGSRWEVPDGPTGLMMYVFHDRLRHGVPLARALRETQLWLLDPDRRLPDGMPRAVADILHDADPSAPELWAAFACQGH